MTVSVRAAPVTDKMLEPQRSDSPAPLHSWPSRPPRQTILRSAESVPSVDFPTALHVCPGGAGEDGHTLCAVVRSIGSKYGLIVRDERGALQSVTLHQGTIIDPTGFGLKPGTPVYIVGSVVGGTFDADRIQAHLPPARSTRNRWDAAVAESDPRRRISDPWASAEGGG